MLSHSDLYLVFIISFWFLPVSTALQQVLWPSSRRRIPLKESLAKRWKVKFGRSHSPVWSQYKQSQTLIGWSFNRVQLITIHRHPNTNKLVQFPRSIVENPDWELPQNRRPERRTTRLSSHESKITKTQSMRVINHQCKITRYIFNSVRLRQREMNTFPLLVILLLDKPIAK